MKKKTKKALALAICAVMLIAGTALTTLAYLTSQDSVTNTFTVGKVNITLDEALVNEYGKPASSVDENGVYTLVNEVKDAARVEANTYKLIPGIEYVKDPTVTVKYGSEKCYVRMLVTITNYSAIKEAFGEDFLPQYFVEGWEPTVWVSTNTVEENSAKDTATYEFRYVKVVDGGLKDPQTGEGLDNNLAPLFTSFELPGTEITEDNLKEITDGFEIKVVAHAIQEAGFDTVDAAWAAFDAQHSEVY